MKKFYTLLVLCLLPFTGSLAQKPIDVSEDTLKFGSSSLPALSVTIPEADYDKTLKEWTKTLQSGTKSKVVTENKKDMSIFGARIKQISDNPLNIYSNLDNQDDGLALKVAFEPRKDQYIDQSSPEYAKTRNYLLNFAKDRYVDVVNDQVKTEEGKLRDLQKELTALQRDQDKLEKSSRSNKETISTEKDRLTTLNNELNSLSGTIIDDRNQPTGMGSADIKENYVKDLEKKKKKTQKEIEQSEEKVSKSEREIDDAERSIPKIVEEQDRVREKITAQEAVVREYTDKLNTIKEYK